MGDFRRLRAWKEAQRLAILSRDLIGVLPRVETFSLGAHWRRAADSVVLNIAEGASQSSPRQFRRYLEIAKGSLDELDAVFELVEGSHYLSPGRLREVRLARTHCIRLVAALARSISRDLSRHAGQRLTRQRLTR